MPKIADQWFVKFNLEKPMLFPEMELPSDIKLKKNSENKVTMIEIVVMEKWSKAEQIAKERIKKFETILSLSLIHI